MVRKKVKKKVNIKKKSKSGFNKAKLILTFRRFVFFLVFFVLFFILEFITSEGMFNDFFYIGALLFGVISAALLIVLLILWFLKLMKK